MGRVVSQSIPNFLNGVSQQTPTQRGINQGEIQINLQNNIVDGLSKRPSLDYLATLDAVNVLPNTTKFWSIQRDESNQYIVAFYSGGLKVWDLAGVEKTVTIQSGAGYLTSTNPRTDFKLANIADYTFIANKATTVLADTTTSAARNYDFHINCVTTNYGNEYTVKLTHPAMQTALGYGLEIRLQMPDGSSANNDTTYRDSKHIAHILFNGTGSQYWNGSSSAALKIIRTDTGATLSTTAGLNTYAGFTNYFSFQLMNSVIYGEPTDNDPLYTIETGDGAGNSSFYALRDTVSDFTKLPYHGLAGVKIKITGAEGDVLSDYWVEFKTDGVWEECLAPATSLGLDNTTMPHALINNNDGTFTFKELDWTDRKVGDGDSNSDPSFVGKKINNLTFYKNRLGLLAGENLILTENADFFNFFSTTVTQSLDTDAIDIATSGTQVNTLKNSVSFNESLLLFSDTAQYKLGSTGNTALSPTSAVLNEVSSFEHDANVRPVSAGKFAYFAQSRNNNTAIREYYADDNTLTNDGLDITVSVQDLLPTNAYQLISNTTEDTVVVLTADAKDAQTAPYSTGSAVTATNATTMYIYKYFFDKGEKVQTAWSKWEFTGLKILGGVSKDSFIYLLANEGTTLKLFKIDLRNLKDTTIGFSVYLDLKKQVVGTYDAGTNLTTVTSPYGVKTGLIAVDAVNGNNYSLTNTAGSDYTLEGNHTDVYIGVPFQSQYRLSTQYIRETSGRGLVAITSGRYQIRNISINYENSGYFEAQVTPTGRNLSNSIMNGYIIGTATSKIGVPAIQSGTLRVPVSAKNTDFTFDIKSNSHLPMYVASAEVEGYYHNRSTRI